MDWHQTGNKVIISLFTKCADPTKTTVKVNRVSIDIYVTFGADSIFTQSFELNGVSLSLLQKLCYFRYSMRFTCVKIWASNLTVNKLSTY